MKDNAKKDLVFISAGAILLGLVLLLLLLRNVGFISASGAMLGSISTIGILFLTWGILLRVTKNKRV